MRIWRGKKVRLHTASGYVVTAKTIVAYTVGGERYVVLKLDQRVKPTRGRLLAVVPRPGSDARGQKGA